MNERIRLVIVLLIFSTGAIAQQNTTTPRPGGLRLPLVNHPNDSDTVTEQHRSPWELGIHGGSLTIMGEVTPRFQFAKTGAFAINLKRSFGRFFSIRAEWMFWGQARGLNYKPSINYLNNPAWINNGYYAAYRPPNGNHQSATQASTGIVTRASGPDPVFYNYTSKINDVLIEGILSWNDISSSRFNAYGLLGGGLSFYKTKIDALSGGLNYAYDFSGIISKYGDDFNKNRRQIRNELKGLLDGDYESMADTDHRDVNNERRLFGQTYTPTITAGFGITYRTSPRLDLALEYRTNFTFTSLLDGQRWREEPLGDPSLITKNDRYDYFSAGIHIHIANDRNGQTRRHTRR